MGVQKHTYRLVKWSDMLRGMAVALFLFAVFADTNAADEGRGNQTSFAIDVKSCAKPEWPKDALAANRTGTVTMALLVGADSHVKKSRIIRSSGHPDLDDAAVNGLSRCRFAPGKVDGKPVDAWMQVQYVWTIE